MDGADERGDSDREAAERILSLDVEELVGALHGTSERPGPPAGPVVATGVGAAPGVGSGPLVTTLDAALDAADAGRAPVLVVDETGPADEPAMRCAAAVVTRRGGLASHAAVVARAWGIPAVCGLSGARVDDDGVSLDDVRLRVGEVVTVDGGTGELRLGGDDTPSAAGLSADMVDTLATCDRLVGGRPQVWVNAETADEVRSGLGFGARGVGLCRTEHQFLGARLPLLQSVLLGGGQARDAAQELGAYQRAVVAELLAAAEGLPVVVRLLDPPLHEFLPSPDDETSSAALRDLAADWYEHNPMLGARGVRLATVAPGVVDTQLSAVLAAARDLRSVGTPCDLRILVPMVTWPAELELVRARVGALAQDLGVPVPPIGAMVETPAAALRAAELVRHADFLSIGTNDLSQLTLGLSRDDAEARLLAGYLTAGLVGRSPFETLDDSVALLVATAVAAAPDADWSVCGEHAADAASLDALSEVPLGHVSCSPFRVPVARLAVGRRAARAVLSGGRR